MIILYQKEEKDYQVLHHQQIGKGKREETTRPEDSQFTTNKKKFQLNLIIVRSAQCIWRYNKEHR